MSKTDSKSSESDQSDSQSKSGKINGVAISRYVVFLFLAVGGCAADLITKQMMFGTSPAFKDGYFRVEARVPVVHWWIDGVLGIETTTNLGALWGAGQGMQFWFALLSIIAFFGIILWLFVFRSATSWIITIALGLITGGIFGNLYDRLGLWHGPEMSVNHANGVRDWIHFRWQNAPGFLQSIFNPWPNFNIADSVLVCGAILLVFHAFFLQPKMEKKDAADDENATAESTA